MSKTVQIYDEAAAIVAQLSARTGLTEAEVLTEGVRALNDGQMPRSEAFERWLREQVAAGYDDHKADPDSAITAGELMRRLRQRSAQRRTIRPE